MDHCKLYGIYLEYMCLIHNFICMISKGLFVINGLYYMILKKMCITNIFHNYIWKRPTNQWIGLRENLIWKWPNVSYDYG